MTAGADPQIPLLIDNHYPEISDPSHPNDDNTAEASDFHLYLSYSYLETRADNSEQAEVKTAALSRGKIPFSHLKTTHSG